MGLIHPGTLTKGPPTMRKLPIALTVLSIFAAPLAAHADSYTFSISTGPSTGGSPAASFVASGTLTGTASAAPPALTLTGVTGSAQGYVFTGVVPLGTANSFTYDNLLYTSPSARHVDTNGVLLFLSSSVGTSLAHVYDNNGYHVDVFDPREPGDVTPFNIQSFDITPAAVPEPSTLALLGTGALGVLGAVRRRLFSL